LIWKRCRVGWMAMILFLFANIHLLYKGMMSAMGNGLGGLGGLAGLGGLGGGGMADMLKMMGMGGGR